MSTQTYTYQSQISLSLYFKEDEVMRLRRPDGATSLTSNVIVAMLSVFTEVLKNEQFQGELGHHDLSPSIYFVLEGKVYNKNPRTLEASKNHI